MTPPIAKTRKNTTLLPLDKEFLSVSRKQQLICLSLYILMVTFAIILINTTEHQSIKTVALGLILPGSGFLYGAGPENPDQLIYIALAIAIFTVFLLSLVMWLATGNIILPAVIWLGSAIAAGLKSSVIANSNQSFIWQTAPYYLALCCALALLSIACLFIIQHFIQHRNGKELNEQLSNGLSKKQPGNDDQHNKSNQESILKCSSHSQTRTDELTLEDLKLMRVLLDRALQPLDEFKGFEWNDQFQSGAVRYQLNFMSYALSIAQSVHVPAFKGYLSTAQKNLALKQQDHRIWGYWKYENLWGNLNIDSDPIPHENIMYTGFVTAQLSYFQASNQSHYFSEPGSFSCQHPSGELYAYTLPELIGLLKNQYKSAKYGLLACEPNWIYPLCNFITTSALRTYDTAYNTSHWQDIEVSFRHHLEKEFIRPDGQMLPFRSSYTGFASPIIGGAIMQSFPCLFLNMICPDIAGRQWEIFRERIKGKDLKKACWPIDVGNYKFSRASSYTATAAAAIELGDEELASQLMQHLDEDCPKQTINNVIHREKSSLWAHAVELMARCGQKNAFKNLAGLKVQNKPGPYIKEISYPQVLVAKAHNENNTLSLVLYPGEIAGIYPLTIGNLKPNHTYTASTNITQSFQSDKQGEAILNIPIHGRTEVHIVPKDEG